MAMNDDEATRTITRNEAARILRRHPRTVVRMADDGRLTRLPDGTFVAEEVEQLADEAARDGEPPPDVLIQFYQDLTGHYQNLLKLTHAPTQQAIDALIESNRIMAARLESAEASRLDYLAHLGDLLVQKEEREQIKLDGEQRRAAQAEAMAVFRQLAPVLVSQLKQGKGSAEGKIVGAIQGLSAEQQAMLASALMMAGEEAGDLLAALETIAPDAVAFAREAAKEDDPT